MARLHLLQVFLGVGTVALCMVQIVGDPVPRWHVRRLTRPNPGVRAPVSPGRPIESLQLRDSPKEATLSKQQLPLDEPIIVGWRIAEDREDANQPLFPLPTTPSPVFPPALPNPTSQAVHIDPDGGRPGLPTPLPTTTTTTTQAPERTTKAAVNDTLIYSVSSDSEDGYFFDFLVANSIRRMEQGYFKEGENKSLIHVKSGLYSFTTPEGRVVKINYIADEKGYRTIQTLQ